MAVAVAEDLAEVQASPAKRQHQAYEHISPMINNHFAMFFGDDELLSINNDGDLTVNGRLWMPKTVFPSPNEDQVLFLFTMIGSGWKRFVKTGNVHSFHSALRECREGFPTFSFSNQHAPVSDWQMFEAAVAGATVVATLPSNADELQFGKPVFGFLRDLVGELSFQTPLSPDKRPNLVFADGLSCDFVRDVRVPVCGPPNQELPRTLSSDVLLGTVERAANAKKVDVIIKQVLGDTIADFLFVEAKLRAWKLSLQSFVSTVERAVEVARTQLVKIYILVTSVFNVKSLGDFRLQPAPIPSREVLARSAQEKAKGTMDNATKDNEMDCDLLPWEKLSKTAKKKLTPAERIGYWMNGDLSWKDLSPPEKLAFFVEKSDILFVTLTMNASRGVTCQPLFPGIERQDPKHLYVVISMQDIGCTLSE